MTLFTNETYKELPIPECNCYDHMIRYALKMIQTTEKPINDISDATISLEMALKIKELIQ